MSITYIGLLAEILTFVLPKIGVNITGDALTNAITVLVQIVGGVLIYVGRLRAGGITPLGLRK
jgi:hypothetical protein